MSLNDKTILVTGAASGIGAETACILKARGAQVIGFDRNRPLAGVDEYIHYDQSDPQSIEAALLSFAGKADALCNIAGVPPTAGAAKVLAVNFLGMRWFTEQAVSKLKDGGQVINVSSMAGFFWQQNLALVNALIDLKSIGDAEAFCASKDIVANGMGPTSCYPLSKQAATAWTIRNFSRWTERGIRMNVVSPGPVDTPILKDFTATIGDIPKEGFLGKLRHGKPEDIAQVIAFLCSDEAAWINGVNLPADGGLSAFLTNSFGLAST